MARKTFQKGLDHRQRDNDGEIRRKRSDTLVGTLRKEYGEGFLRNYRPTAQLGTALKKERVDSLYGLLRRKK